MFLYLCSLFTDFIQHRFILIFMLTYIFCLRDSMKESDLNTFYIKENSRIGEIVGQINIPGFIPPYEIHYFQDKNFVISKTTGIIKVTGLIDREKQDIYSFLIISMNGETKNLQIKILDENDNEPRFNVSSLEKTIPENYPVGSKVDLTTVYDPDEGKNSIQVLKIISGDYGKIFAIDYHDGSNGLFYLRLILKQPLDYETISQFNFVIQAIDGGSPPLQSTLLVKVNVQNANDNVPKFDVSRYIVSIKEDHELNKPFLRVRATDNDFGLSGELFYFMETNSADNKYFSVHHKTGDISLRMNLDFEQKKSHQISIVVRDNSPLHTSKVPVIIDVIDVNDNPPNIQTVWAHGSPLINEDDQLNSILAHIKVTDADLISTSFKLNILNQSDFQLINIQPTLWELRLVNLSNFESDHVNVTLQAFDFPEPSLSTTLILRINVKQSFLGKIFFKKTLYNIELETPLLYNDYKILTIELNRPVAFKSKFYFILSNHNNVFNINKTSGVLTSINFVDCGIYLLNVSLILVNNKLPIDHTQIKIIIKGDRKRPLYFEKGFYKITLEIGKRQCFSQIAVKNRHCGMRIQYRLINMSRLNGPLYFNKYGVLCTKDDFEDIQLTNFQFLYMIKAIDENVSNAFCIVLFIVIPSINIKALMKEINVTLPKSERQLQSNPIAKVLGTFLTYSPVDFRGIIQYQIVSEEQLDNELLMDSHSGEVSIRSYSVDKSMIIAKVKLFTSDITPSAFNIITLKINFKEIYFTKSLYQFIINENQINPVSVDIGQVSINFDSSRTIGSTAYHLQNSEKYSAYFSIDHLTGMIKGRNLNFLSTKSIGLSVYAKQTNGEECYSQVLIFLENSLRPPTFHFPSMSVNLWENTTVGTEIFQILPKHSSASDLFNIIPGKFSNFFTIHHATGQLFLKKIFDWETIKVATIQIMLTNEIGTNSIDLQIEILDVNDNEPQCTNLSHNVLLPDRSEINSNICALQCVDTDSFINANLSYNMKMVSPTGMDNPFDINVTTGCLFTIASLDQWVTNPDGKYNFIITVSDNAPGHCLKIETKVNIVIFDSNNHRPSLISYGIFYILGTAEYGSEVGVLITEDADKGLNGEVDISIKDFYYREHFYLEQSTSKKFIIRTKNLSTMNLNYGSHNICLVLSDKGTPSQSSIVFVTINIEDTNRHIPEIIYPRQVEPVLFQCPLIMGSKVFKVKSIDLDRGLNSKLRYYLQTLNDNNDLLDIDVWSGVVVNKITLPCSKNYQLRIFVSDLGFPKKTNVVETILKPYQKKGYSADNLLLQNLTLIISNNSSPGSFLGNLTIFPNYLGAKFLFSNNRTSTFDNFLHIQYNSERLILLNHMINMTKASYQIYITFHKSNILPSPFMIYLNIIINRLQTPWPKFSKDSPKSLFVKENLPTGSFVGNFCVIVAENLSVRFTLRQPSIYFVINPQTGVLSTFRPIDRETERHDILSIEIIATDIANIERFTVQPVSVFIVDENDNVPKIISPSNYTIEIFYLGSTNQSITRIIATDDDKGRNSVLNFSIPFSAENIFSIDQNSGEIFLLSEPKNDVYDLNVSVSDLGIIPKIKWIVLNIWFKKLKHKTYPKLLPSSLSINLTIPQNKPGHILGQLSNMYQTVQHETYKYILMAAQFSHIFSIDSKSGIIKTMKPVSIKDLGNTDTIYLSVILQHVQDPLSYDVGELKININYGNQYVPQFLKSLYKVKLPEDEAITDFLTVAAHDADRGIYGKVIYRLTGDIDDKKIFIDSLTGKLSCGPLNYMKKKLYKLKVIAMDSDGNIFSLSNVAKVTVLVQHTKKHPLAFNSTHFTLKVKENASPGTKLGRINVIKPPINTELIYILNPSNFYIQINSTTGELQTNRPLYREKNQFIDLTIQAYARSLVNWNTYTVSAIVDIIIIDLNNNAPIPFENPVKILIPDTSMLPNPIARLSAIDLDKLSNITFTFDLKNPLTLSLNSFYHLDMLSGNLFLKFPIPNTEKATHILQVIVSDNGTPSKSTSMLIDISLNYEPIYVQVWPVKAVFKVMENSVPGTFIGQIKVINNCSNGHFVIIDGVNQEFVYLHGVSGKIFVAASKIIDREKIDLIILWTKITCQEPERRGYKKVTIHVEDVDDNKPIFAQSNYVAFVNEGQPPKTSVINTVVYDPDVGINSQVEYFIEHYSAQDEFIIDSYGEVKTNIPLNYHTKSVYHFVIKATSKSSPLIFAEARLTVYVININDQRPIISPSTQSIKIDSNTPVGSILKKITAKDSDGPDGIFYRIRSSRMSNETLFLSIAYDAGEITLSRKLSVSDIGKHELNVIADDGKFSFSSLIFVEVVDHNNHVPVLRENTQTVVLLDSAKPGSQFFLLHSEDIDLDNVNFELTNISPWFGLHDFNNNTAALYVIDHPPQSNIPYFLGIQLSDNPRDIRKRLTSVSTITVIFKSFNSNNQIIFKPTSFINITESTSFGSLITKVNCQDTFSMHSVFYKLNTSSTFSDIFHINVISGELFLTKSLKHSLYQNFDLVIICEVIEDPQKKVFFPFSIFITEKEELPILSRSKYLNTSFQMSNFIQLPALVFNINTIDEDSLPFLYQILSIIPYNPENIQDPPIFKIDSQKNLWLIDGNILQCKSWTLIIKAISDKEYSVNPSNIYSSSYIYVNITVPKYLKNSLERCVDLNQLTGVINENEPSMTSILDLPIWYEDIKYDLSPNEDFDLSCSKSDGSKCAIKSKISFDYETKDNYRFQLLVTGSIAPAKSCSHVIMVDIFILDVDEYVPEFTQTSYSHSVKGGIPKIDQIVFTVYANDRDGGRFGLVLYQLVKNHYENFGIKNNTGEIYIKSAFIKEREEKNRIKRSTNENEKPKNSRKSFQFRISASSGVKTSFAYVELNILVPDDNQNDYLGSRLTGLHVILLSTVPTSIFILIIIIALIFLMKRRYICNKEPIIYKDSNISSRTDSPKTTNSWNIHNSQPSLLSRNLPFCSKRFIMDTHKSPDINQGLPLKYYADNLPNSDTQDFSLSFEDERQLTTSSLSTYEHHNVFSHSSEISIKPEDQSGNCHNQELNKNSFSYSQMNCDSGIGYGHRICDYYDGSGMENKKISKVAFEQNMKYQDSNISLTSSSGYSAISNNNQQNIHPKIPCSISMHNPNFQQNHTTFNHSSMNKYRDGTVNYGLIPRSRISLGTLGSNRSRQFLSSTALKSHTDLMESIQLQCLNQQNPLLYPDVVNKNHHCTLPMIPKYLDEFNYQNNQMMNFYPYPYDFQPRIAIQTNHSTLNNMTVPETYTQPYADITEI